jgi:hypothetical protein
MQRFKLPEQAQRFLSPHATASQYQRACDKGFRVWREETWAKTVA